MTTDDGEAIFALMAGALPYLGAMGTTRAQPVRYMPQTPRHTDPEAAERLRDERAKRKAANYRKRYNITEEPDDGREGA